MSRALVGWVIVIAALSAALVWVLRDADPPQPKPPAVRVAPQVEARSASPRRTANPAPPSPPAASQPPEQTLEQAFHEAADLLAFIDSIRPAAQAGDGASAWWIYRALQRCATEYRTYFQRGGRILTLDEALQLNASNPFLPLEETRKLHEQCARLRESSPEMLNSWVNWLTMAADEIPLARVELARHLLRDGKNRSLASSQRVAAQRQAIHALQSKDPAAVAAMSELAALANGSGVSSGHFEWLVAGCQRGLDCSPQSEFVTRWCRGDPNCQPFEDVEAVLRRISPAEYDVIEQRAHEINALLDQGRIEELVYPALPDK